MRYKLLFALFALFASCSQYKKRDLADASVPRIKVNPLDSQTVYIEDISDDVYHVTLDTSASFGISRITNFFSTDSNIIISDRSQACIFIYDFNGKPKAKINGSTVKGGKYTFMTDVIVDEAKSQIEVVDMTMSKIFRYNFAGKFIDSAVITEPRYGGITFAKNKDLYVSELLNNNPDKRRISIYKSTGNRIDYVTQKLFLFPIIKGLDIGYPHQFDNYKDSLLYFPLLDDKIYAVTVDDVKPAYQIEVPEENRIGLDLMTEKAKDHFEYWKKMESGNIMYDNNSLFVNRDWVSFNYNFQSNKTSRTIFYSKRSGKVIQFVEFKSRVNPAFHLRSPVIGKRGEYFVMRTPYPYTEPLKQDENKGQLKNRYVFMFLKLKTIS